MSDSFTVSAKLYYIDISHPALTFVYAKKYYIDLGCCETPND